MTSTSVTAVGALSARVAHEGQHVALALAGLIDERSDFGQLSAKLGSGEILVVELSAIKRINSVGVRDWVHWLRDIATRFKTVLLVNVSPALMHEVAMVRNFFEGAHVLSFQLPYFCAACEREGSVSCDTASLLKGTQSLTAPSCDACGRATELDEDEAELRAFLAQETSHEEFKPRAEALLGRLANVAPLTFAQPVQAPVPASPLFTTHAAPITVKRRDGMWVALIVALVAIGVFVLVTQLGG